MKECTMILSIFYTFTHVYICSTTIVREMFHQRILSVLHRSPNRIVRYRHIWNSLCKRFLTARPTTTILYTSLRSVRFYLRIPQLIHFALDIVRLTTTSDFCSYKFLVCLLGALENPLKKFVKSHRHDFYLTHFFKLSLLNMFPIGILSILCSTIEKE